jgi:uncharacterized Zn ribbon protein
MYRSYDEYDAEQARLLDLRPVCDICGEKILDDYAYNDGIRLRCPECWEKYVDEEFRVSVDDLMDEKEGW